MAESTTWTPKREARLRELHGSGLTFAEIAELIGGVTRNAVIGKANRLGLRFKPATQPGGGGEAKTGTGSDRTAVRGKRGRAAARTAPAKQVKGPRLPDATGRPPRAPEYKVLDKYYQGRTRRGGRRRIPSLPEPGSGQGVLDKYYVGKDKVARARRVRREREERALIRMREAVAAKARQEAERAKRARAAELKAGKSAATKSLAGAPARKPPRATGSGASAALDCHASGAAVPGQDASPMREPLRIPLVALTDSTCRWPLGDPDAGDFAFCGLPALPRKPYCTDHAKLAYQPMASRRPRERDAGK